MRNRRRSTSAFTANDIANLNTVTHGDCVEVMSRMEAASIDFVITGPPLKAGAFARRPVERDRLRRGVLRAVFFKIAL
jgi:DNA modification methylase